MKVRRLVGPALVGLWALGAMGCVSNDVATMPSTEVVLRAELDNVGHCGSPGGYMFAGPTCYMEGRTR